MLPQIGYDLRYQWTTVKTILLYKMCLPSVVSGEGHLEDEFEWKYTGTQNQKSTYFQILIFKIAGLAQKQGWMYYSLTKA